MADEGNANMEITRTEFPSHRKAIWLQMETAYLSGNHKRRNCQSAQSNHMRSASISDWINQFNRHARRSSCTFPPTAGPLLRAEFIAAGNNRKFAFSSFLF
jgi:hypothetical protein